MQLIKALIIILLASISINATASETLIFSIDLLNQPTDGAAAKLGQALRKQYVEQSHLLPKIYQPNTLLVRSTAQMPLLTNTHALMLGLYPKNKRTSKELTIPIYSISAKNDDLASVKASDALSQTFLELATNYFALAISQKPPLKYVLFSGYNNALTSVATKLNLPEKTARLNLSLFKNGNDYLVKISYDNKPVDIAKCGGSTCTLKQFIALSRK